ncbi:hypothetical protein [Roseiconus lacunae]|uniref:hypothetical protein n=1 Tax=Roseiconus lacunae TaxID=2605694 RepID=UPI001E2B3043|nr:hypothetical protein [Roseiconus lacunae]MCD0462483.1 hypothetical protein [Roseiconus lacunae]
MNPSKKARELFDHTRRILLGVPSAQRLWERSLNSAERKMLGDSFREAFEDFPNAAQMWARVKQVNYPLAVIEVAETLNLLTHTDAEWLRHELGELPADPAAAEIAAIDRGDLVLSLRERTLYRLGEECFIAFDRHPSLWDFWVTVCRAAKRGEGVGWDSFGENKRENYVTQTKSRLSKLPGFPIDLINLIVVDGVGRQRLDVPAEQIFIAE